MIKEADIMARPPFCSVSLHVERGYIESSPASESVLPLIL